MQLSNIDKKYNLKITFQVVKVHSITHHNTKRMKSISVVHNKSIYSSNRLAWVETFINYCIS